MRRYLISTMGIVFVLSGTSVDSIATAQASDFKNKSVVSISLSNSSFDYSEVPTSSFYKNRWEDPVYSRLNSPVCEHPDYSVACHIERYTNGDKYPRFAASILKNGKVIKWRFH